MSKVLQEGIENAIKLMEKGCLNRYQPATVATSTLKDSEAEEDAYLLKFERAMAKYVGTKYAIGLNSGASAIFLAMKCGGIAPGSKVMTNAFTFNAVPSAIVHAGCEPVLVECTDTFTIDLNDLESKIIETGSKCLVLSYMRGRIPDLDKVMDICENHNVYMIEDAAHAYGCEYKGKKIGTFGKSACLSTQANKLMNAGEGGLLLTSDDHIMGRAICSAGCYEDYMLKHKEMCPPMNLMNKYRMECVNFSLRMTNLQGAILLPQVAVLDERRTILNRNYYSLVKKLSAHPNITVPGQLPEVTPVADSIQFMVNGLTSEGLRKFVSTVKETSGLKLGVFGFMENARNYRTWKFMQIDGLDLPKTDEFIGKACDTRLHLDATEADLEKMAAAITTSLNNVLKLDDLCM